MLIGPLYSIDSHADNLVAWKDQVESVRALLPIEVKAKVQWGFCGEVNGWYEPDTDTINLCLENLAEGPSVATAIYLHEIGHAVMCEYDLPFVGNLEQDADEFMAVMSITLGHPEWVQADALEMATWDTGVVNPGDTHPPAIQRALWLLRLLDGYQEHDALNIWYWKRAVRAWRIILLYTVT